MKEAEHKLNLRRRLRQKVTLLTQQQRCEHAAELLKMVLEQAAWRNARRILLYFPRPDEPDIRLIESASREAGKTVAFPRYRPRTDDYDAAVIAAANEDAQPGKFGILEPLPRCPALPLNQLDLVLVPGVGFDLLGRRLGRGRGFYDRLLAQVTGVKCGVAFDEQMVEEIPVEAHDVFLDCILTPTRWHQVVS